MLDLVTKLYKLEQDQTRDVRGALFDKGKYVLSKQAAVLSLVRDLDPVVARTEVKTSLEICKFQS